MGGRATHPLPPAHSWEESKEAQLRSCIKFGPLATKEGPEPWTRSNHMTTVVRIPLCEGDITT